MFAPALLLLAAVGHSVAEVVPPVKTIEIKGESWPVFNREEKFFIPNQQCYGVLKVNEQAQLKCRYYETVRAVKVTVWDYNTVDIMISDDLNDVKIERHGSSSYPCFGNAIVDVQVSCKPRFTAHEDGPRHELLAGV